MVGEGGGGVRERRSKRRKVIKKDVGKGEEGGRGQKLGGWGEIRGH